VRLFALALAALVLAAPSAHAGSRPSESDLETLLVCPTCHETLDESNSPVAQQMKAEIRRRIAQGWTKKQILDEMVANFGPGVLSTPATHGFDLLAWVLPLGGIALAAVALGGGAAYWTRSRDDEAAKVIERDDHLVENHLDPELERRVDEELARFDA
jgi:cytochrome c-type biogenesis protein CcmH